MGGFGWGGELPELSLLGSGSLRREEKTAEMEEEEKEGEEGVEEGAFGRHGELEGIEWKGKKQGEADS